MAMADHFPLRERVRARMEYTGERFQTARRHLEIGSAFDPIVPDAGPSWDQVLLEEKFLSRLAYHVGAHSPAQFNNAAYGIRSVSPLTAGCALLLDERVLALVAAKILPRWTGKHLTGIPGLRYQADSRSRVILYQHARPASITLERAHGWIRYVNAAERRAREEAPLWNGPQWSHDKFEKHRSIPDEDEVRRWSTALRRIALWSQAHEIDFHTALPEIREMAGSRPDLLRPQRVRFPRFAGD
ncbi:hypothetical protein MOQ72_43555 [Saccharopolyspora sp. K220]|uniref:hypothetical protein n=1 Tax=Saccharopolyspora soli TaxID=2926618 RepID=UPI001F57A020|nr:hypothetical protein [Saccharopolyspora soli]MCI2424291.1 hypothetical protein [Saccharopolyspora soli]